jgi:hypothetical protein
MVGFGVMYIIWRWSISVQKIQELQIGLYHSLLWSNMPLDRFTHDPGATMEKKDGNHRS